MKHFAISAILLVLHCLWGAFFCLKV